MKTAKVFKQGNGQAVRLPKEFRLSDDEVEIRHEGEANVLLPRSATRWRHVAPAWENSRASLNAINPRGPAPGVTCVPRKPVIERWFAAVKDRKIVFV